MKHQYRHMIPQNIAPPGATAIVVCDASGNEVAHIPLGPLTPPSAVPLYSFGLMSDMHLYPIAAVAWKPERKLRAALTYMQSEGCVMVVHCGDITQTGFYRERTLDDGSTEVYYDPVQMQEYKTIREEFDIPVWGICANHESYCKSVSESMDDVEECMGICALSYTISSGESTDRNVQVAGIGDDLFILCGQPSAGYVMSDEDFQWLTETLAANEGRRCFVFIHSYMEEDAGDPADVRENSIFEHWGTSRTQKFVDLLRQHSDHVVLFHGHSHMKFVNQEYDPAANYTKKNGFHSVHVPSLGVPRDVDLVNNKSVDDPTASEGYIVDVHQECIVLRGWDFVGNAPAPLGTMRIEI